MFDIDESTGQLYTTDEVEYAFDFEIWPSYGVTVRAEDGRGGSATITVTVALTAQPNTTVALQGKDSYH